MRGTAVGRNAAGLAVVQPAGELPDHQHVSAGHDARLQRSGRFEPRPDLGGAEVRVKLQLATDREERRLRPATGVAFVECGIADRAKQDGVGRPGGSERLLGERRKIAAQRGPTNGRVVQFELMVETRGNRSKDRRRGGDDLRANAVAGQEENGRVHSARVLRA